MKKGGYGVHSDDAPRKARRKAKALRRKQNKPQGVQSMHNACDDMMRKQGRTPAKGATMRGKGRKESDASPQQGGA